MTSPGGKWTDRAETFAHSYAHLCAYTAPALLDAAGVGPGIRLLDVGTGTGTVAALAAERGARVTAVDAEPSMVRLARRTVADVHQGRLPELPFADGAFDAVVANFVVNHVTDPRRAVAELHRLVAPGGRLAVTVWPQPPPPLQQLWFDVMAATGITPAPSSVPAELNFPRTVKGLTDLLTAAGADNVTGETITWVHRTSIDAWWIGPANGMGALGEALVGRDADTIAAARLAYERLAATYLDHEGALALPTSAVLASGNRPHRKGPPGTARA